MRRAEQAAQDATDAVRPVAEPPEADVAKVQLRAESSIRKGEAWCPWMTGETADPSPCDSLLWLERGTIEKEEIEAMTQAFDD